MDPEVEHIGGLITSAILPHKVSCVRWVSEPYDKPQTFLTSSWDNRQNSVTLWSQFHDAMNDEGFPAVPENFATKHLTGDIVGFEFVGEQYIACATSEGALSILEVLRDSITEKVSLPSLHSSHGFSAPCIGVSVYNQDVATIGEDGCLKIVSAFSGAVSRSLELTIGLTCVSFVQADTVLVGGKWGGIHRYDIRVNTNTPVMQLYTNVPGEEALISTTCIAYQPLQKQIVFAGLEDGSILAWDFRNPGIRSTQLKPHNGPVNAISFKKNDSRMMFSATNDGDVYQWLLKSDFTVEGKENHFKQFIRSYGPVVENYDAINSMDVTDSHMICAGDDAFVYVLEF